MLLQVFTGHILTLDKDKIDVTRMGTWLARKRSADGPDVPSPPGEIFAPSWELLRAMKAGRLSWETFTLRYNAEMRASYRANRALWDAFLKRKRLVLCCYCTPPPLRCHRVLLEAIFVKLGAEAHGELCDLRALCGKNSDSGPV
jgi:hypothetical protein